MEEKSKSNLGLKQGKKFTTSERHQIIQEMISTDSTKRDTWEKHTGETKEHGELLRWMRALGYDEVKKPNFARNTNEMTRGRTNTAAPTEDSFEILQLKKRNLELEIQLKEAELKAIAFSTMIDIAEKEFSIPIRKKVNTKPLRK